MRRAVLLCGQERPLLAAIARALAGADARLFVQADGRELSAAQRLSAAGSVTVVRGGLGGESASRQLATAAWKAAGRIDAVIICPALGGAAAATASPSGDEWQVGLDAGLRAPFFLARQVGTRMRAGSRLLFAIGGLPSGAGPLPRVVRSALRPMLVALARVWGPRVAVAAVIGGARSTAPDIARGVRLLLDEAPPLPSGTILELGGPSHRG